MYFKMSLKENQIQTFKNIWKLKYFVYFSKVF